MQNPKCLKITFVGPNESGKSYLSNYLASFKNPVGEYRPTKGVRILEFTATTVQMGKQLKTDIELWDCSGSQEVMPFWRSFSNNMHGVVIVYNPHLPLHAEELENIYKHFVLSTELRYDQCLLVANYRNDAADKFLTIPEPMTQLRQLDVKFNNNEDDAGQLRVEFNEFLAQVLDSLKNTQEGSAIRK